MYLKTINIEAAKEPVTPGGLVFHSTVHHVKEIFTALLPKRFTLDGSSLLQINAETGKSEAKYQSLLGSSVYSIGRFDFEAYAQASSKAREIQILDIIQNVCAEIATLNHQDPHIIRETATQVRESKFNLKRKVSKLSRLYPGRKLRINVYRNLSADGGEFWGLEISNQKTIVHEKLISKKPQYLDLRDYYMKSEWDNQDFVIKNRLNKEVYRLDVTSFLA